MGEVSIEGELSRHVPDNPYGYTNLEKAERAKAIKDMAKDYPNLPGSWLDMVYDFWKNTPSDEVERIISDGAWEKPGTFSNPKGGVVYSAQVLDCDDAPFKQRYAGIRGLDGEVGGASEPN